MMRSVGLAIAFALCLLVIHESSRGVITTHVFGDNQSVQSVSGLTRTVLPADKLVSPVISGNGSFDANPYMYGTVIFDEDEGIYKAWYQSYNYGQPTGPRTPVLYATSTDGQTWTRPNLGLVSFGGSTNNSILFQSAGFGDIYSPSVIKDPDETNPDRRYKMIFWDKTSSAGTYDGGAGMNVAFSSDGIHWTRKSGNPQIPAIRDEDAISDVADLMIDPITGKYVVYSKTWKWNGTNALYRMISRTESDDFENWSTPQLVLDTRESDSSQPQTYGMPVFVYEGQYWGLLRSYKSPGNETIEIELTHSRDGVNWTRVAPGEALIPLGQSGTWDDGMIFTAPAILKDGQFKIYYGGWNGPHNAGSRSANIGLATVDEGRLVALTPSNGSGILTTNPMAPPAAIYINADANGGQIRAALIDENGDPLPGFSFDDFNVFTGDELSHLLTWDSINALEVAIADEMRLQLELTDGARLFSISIVPTPEPSAGLILLISSCVVMNRRRTRNNASCQA